MERKTIGIVTIAPGGGWKSVRRTAVVPSCGRTAPSFAVADRTEVKTGK
ncbi:MAG: hypothetical protein PHV82_07740 [Victivallaceae bacterium]|nr:hypothetical protein [Victivallaceae bacterium]